jgi:hypothetical protein
MISAMSSANDQIREFWSWFMTNRLELSKLASPEERFWDVTLAQIKRIDTHLGFELSGDRHPSREFVVTAEGHVESFPVAEELIHLAPEIAGWTFVCLKPPQGFQFITTYEGIQFDPRQMWFMPLESASRPADLGIRVAVPGLDRMDKKTAHNAVLVILDTAIGERSAALDLQYTEVTELPNDPASVGYIELSELAEYYRLAKDTPRPSICLAYSGS